MTRKQMIRDIICFANYTPSIKKLAGMPLENLKALYSWMFFGENELEELEREV